MLELKNITAGYQNKPVLERVHASFQQGRMTGIIGVNGCGKSTLLKSMAGILPLSGGEILVDEIPLGSMGRNEIARRIAYLPQSRNTPEMTVAQLVLHGRFPHLSYPRRYGPADREMAERAMETVGISHLSHQPLRTLSGGLRQKVYIATALAQDTPYILLDEPATYLDIAHQLDLMKLLRTLADTGKGIISVMHDLPLAFDFSDEILVIHNGTIASRGTPQKIATSSVIASIFGVNLEKSKSSKYTYHYDP